MPGKTFRVAIVGAGTLKGKELAEVLPEIPMPIADTKLLDDDDSLGQLEAVGGEVTFVQSVSRDNFDNIDFAFFASNAQFTRRNWTLARDAGASVVDLSYALESEKNAKIRAPWIERELGQTPVPELQPGPVVAAHPAAVMLALLLIRAQRVAPVRIAVATVFEPASEYGRAGMDELHEQTVNLLSLKEMPKQVFDIQVAFNLITGLGEESTALPLESTERRMLEHYRQIVSGNVPAPSLTLVQAPVFHGYAVSLYIELEKAPSVDFAQAIGGDHVVLSESPEDFPNNVSAAGQNDVLVSVRPDLQSPSAFRIWAAADNLRLHALTALECAQRLSATRPKGKVQ
jgi:aspartate-semialdehyde dehydrogenase